MQKAVTVGTSAVVALARNEHRWKVMFTNNGANDIYLAPGAGANTSASIPVKANGGSLVDEPDKQGRIYKGLWTCISGAAAQTLGVTELDVMEGEVAAL